MNRKQLIAQIREKKSFLCVGLDTDLTKIPAHLRDMEDPIFEFNKQIIDAVLPYTVAFKPNWAFYEALGINGLLSLQRTINYIGNRAFTIADAKRGDIGNTALMYAKSFFHYYNCDSVTVAPYMGKDSVQPFMTYANKWAIVLGLTSNDGALDFQMLNVNNENHLYQQVINKVASWGTAENTMFVIGATRGELFKEVRKIVPDHFLLVPGIGAQGGSLEEVCKYGLNADCGLLVNASRSVIYASTGLDFAEKAAIEAQILQEEMASYM